MWAYLIEVNEHFTHRKTILIIRTLAISLTLKKMCHLKIYESLVIGALILYFIAAHCAHWDFLARLQLFSFITDIT